MRTALFVLPLVVSACAMSHELPGHPTPRPPDAGLGVDAYVCTPDDCCTPPPPGAACSCVFGEWRCYISPPPRFACGPDQMCVANLEWCSHTTSDIAGEPDSWSCHDYPATCDWRDGCACFDGWGPAARCTDEHGEVTVLFPGG